MDLVFVVGILFVLRGFDELSGLNPVLEDLDDLFCLFDGGEFEFGLGSVDAIFFLETIDSRFWSAPFLIFSIPFGEKKHDGGPCAF